MERRTRSAVLATEAGQAVVEYILILAITVFIVLGILSQFNSAFSVFTQNLFGNYFACLLETGDLPGASQECQQYWADFDISNGKPAAGGTASGIKSNNGGKADSAGKGGGAGTSTSAGNGRGGSGESDGGESRGGSANPAVRSVRSSSSPSFGKFRQKSTAVGQVSSKEQSALGGADSLLGAAPTSTAMGTLPVSDRKKAAAVTGSYWGVQEEEERQTTRPAVASVKKEGGEQGLRPKKAVENMNRAPAKVQETESSAFSLGALIKGLLIIAIIVIIFVFFGGQVLQISKSREK